MIVVFEILIVCWNRLLNCHPTNLRKIENLIASATQPVCLKQIIVSQPANLCKKDDLIVSTTQPVYDSNISAQPVC